MAVTIQTFDPLSAASDAIGAFANSKRTKDLDAAAQAFAQKQAAQQQSNNDRDYQQRQAELDERTKADATTQAAEAAKAELDARKEADVALHQARVDAIRAAQQRDLEVKDARQFELQTKRINDTYNLGVQRIKSAKDVAEIHAAATEESAKIRASATVEAANIHASATLGAAQLRDRGADRRANERNDLSRQTSTMRDITTRRGQDIRVEALNAQDERAIAAAALHLSAQKNGPKEPTAEQDPHFPKAIVQFYKDSPDERAAFLASPKVPQQTRDYLQALLPVFAAEPANLSVPGDLGGGNEDDDDDTQ